MGMLELTIDCDICATVHCPCADGDPCHFAGDDPMQPAHEHTNDRETP